MKVIVLLFKLDVCENEIDYFMQFINYFCILIDVFEESRLGTEKIYLKLF